MQSKTQNGAHDEREIKQKLKMLKLAVQQVALSAEMQIERFKEFDPAYEVASDFRNWCFWALNSADSRIFTVEQTTALQTLDRHLNDMSGPKNAELWSVEALIGHPNWQLARELAMAIMYQFNWKFDDI